MSTQRSLERSIAVWMADEAAGTASDAVLDHVLLATGRMRPEPRWLALLKEPPMRLQSQVTVGSSTARLTLILVLLGVALLGAVAAAAALRPSPATSDDWPGVRGDATHVSTSNTGPVGQPVIRWTFHAGGAVSANLSIVGDLVLAPSDDGILHALDFGSGAERWTFTADAAPMGGPLVADGRVFVVDGAGTLDALDLADGSVQWQQPLGLVPNAALTAGGGRVYAGTPTGDLVAVDTGSGAVSWRTPEGGAFQVFRPPASADGRVFAGADGQGLIAARAATGERIWTFDTPGASLGTPVVAGDTVFLSGGPAGSPGQLWALDVATGALRWSSPGLGTPAVLGNVGFADGADGVATAYDLAGGAIRWQTPIPGTLRPFAAADGVVYVPADTERRVHALDADTGGELWSIGIDGPNECCIAVARGTVFFGTTLGTVYAIGGDGQSLTPQPPRTAPPPSPTATAVPSPTRSSAPTPTPSPLATPVWQATSPAAGFTAAGLARAPDGQLWVADVENNRFAIFSPDGSYIGSWGHAGTGKGAFNLRRANGDPFGSIAFEPDGSFFVLDVGNRLVQAFDARRRFVTQWGGFGSTRGKLSNPTGIAVGPDGNVSVVDGDRSVIETYRPDGTFVGSFNPFEGVADGANGLTVDAQGNVYVSVLSPNEVRRFDPSGKLTGTFGGPGSGPGAFADQPAKIAVDAAGRVFATQLQSSPGSQGVLVFAPDGTFLGSWGDQGTGLGQLGFPWGIALDGAGGVYTSEYGGDPGIPSESRLQKFQLTLP